MTKRRIMALIIALAVCVPFVSSDMTAYAKDNTLMAAEAFLEQDSFLTGRDDHGQPV